jgi:hypothetical protein
MLKFLNKRPADGEGGGSGLDSNKTPRVEDEAEREGNGAQESAAPEPRTLMTWNCNGLTCRSAVDPRNHATQRHSFNKQQI